MRNFPLAFKSLSTWYVWSRKFCQRGSKSSLTIFILDEGRVDPNTTISGPFWPNQQNAIFMAVCWQTDNDPTLNTGIVAL